MKADTMNEKTIELPPFSELARLTQWLDAKYARHKEIEDADASKLLHTLWRVAHHSRAASESSEVARLLADELRAGISRELASANGDALRRHELRLATDAAIDRLASMATSPASEAQAGWVMVPRELTDDMLVAACKAGCWRVTDYSIKDVRAAYAAVLAAAPQPASSPVTAEGQKAVADDWYERHQAECTKDYGAYDEAAPIAARLRWWVPKSARHGRLTIEDDLLEAAEALATPTASMAEERPGPSGDVPSDFQEGQWWLMKLDELAAHDDDGKRAVATVRNLMRTARAQAATPGPRGENAGGASDAARDVLDERTRQISVEGWTPAHDDEHSSGEMASAAGAYALYVSGRVQRAKAEQLWPWDLEWFKPTSRRRTLVKAGALIIAEIERIDRGLRIAEKGDAS